MRAKEMKMCMFIEEDHAVKYRRVEVAYPNTSCRLVDHDHLQLTCKIPADR